jgi:hypothetical protein
MCLLLALILPVSAVAHQGLLDVSGLTFGPPTAVVEVETSKLKGEIRRLAWEPDGTTLYLQSVEGKAPDEKPHHYTVEVAGGLLTPVDREPDWAEQYWAVKQDRVAPGIPSLLIAIEQTVENLKTGTGASGVLDRESSPDKVAGGSPSLANLANGTHGDQTANVVRLRLLGEEIAIWINERPVPGTRFTWGPSASGALVYVGAHGELVFFDQKKQQQRVPGVRDAFLPAWSTDGTRLAYVQKAGRKKVVIAWLAVGR